VCSVLCDLSGRSWFRIVLYVGVSIYSLTTYFPVVPDVYIM